MNGFEIIDFHTHPFINPENNICPYKEFSTMNAETTVGVMKELGVSKICGSVIEIGNNEDVWNKIKTNNNTALQLKKIYKDFYIPGFHIHPDFIEESLKEINRMHNNGFNLIGELVPYLDNWQTDYGSDEFSVLLEEAGKKNMIVSIHSMNEDAMDKMVKRHKDVVFVAAHPGEYNIFMRHIERMKFSENYYLDLSGAGIFRYRMLRYAIDTLGAERLIFGSDYPTCSPCMYISGITEDKLITDTEKEKILSGNAKKLLNIK